MKQFQTTLSIWGDRSLWFKANTVCLEKNEEVSIGLLGNGPDHSIAVACKNLQKGRLEELSFQKPVERFNEVTAVICEFYFILFFFRYSYSDCNNHCGEKKF